jgi:hypothetical protein
VGNIDGALVDIAVGGNRHERLLSFFDTPRMTTNAGWRVGPFDPCCGDASETRCPWDLQKEVQR